MTLLQKVLATLSEETAVVTANSLEQLWTQLDEMLMAAIKARPKADDDEAGEADKVPNQPDLVNEVFNIVSEKVSELVAQAEDEALSQGFKYGVSLMAEIMSGQELPIF